ncbi:penicillin-binding protein activator [Aidingimonas lacisalsi]|uniref:penicillin-binding protein activator n=1 Tax=Aidingimonas lacisalsi TaxID=2604086 RepID=UPI0011D1A927|nr:penicillin-binding protein activator [Aidingimonas lacisalsi]
MDKSPRSLLAAALLALLIAGCAGQPGPVERDDADPRQLLQQAEEQSAADAARTRLEAADILARRDDEAQALDVARDIDDTQLEVDQRIRWALLLSELALEQGDDKAVIDATRILDDDLDISRGDTSTLRERQGIALGRIGEPLAAVEALLAVQRDTDDLALNDDIWKQVSRLNERQLETLRDDPDRLQQGWLALAELQKRSGGDIDRLIRLYDDWRNQYSNHPAARRTPAELSALRELRDQQVERIAVMLPESGSLADVADEIKEGIETRHMQAVNAGESTPQVMFFDSSNSELDALYAEATMNGAQVVIGPLDKERVTELESRREVPLPTLALNYGRAERNNAENLFQYGLSAEDEARQVARRAYLDGHRRGAVLVPDNDWGARVADAFRQEWESQGGEINAALQYAPDAPVSRAIERLLDVGGNDRARTDDIDMLFLLALPRYARQVPPTLDYYYADDLPVYGTSHLYEGQPQPSSDHDLNDVFFIDIPWLLPNAAVGGEDALPFASTYQSLSDGSDPSLLKLQAMGVDAYELARRLPQIQQIRGTEVFGATGTLHAGEDGRIERELPWAQFIDGIPQLPLQSAARGVFGDDFDEAFGNDGDEDDDEEP